MDETAEQALEELKEALVAFGQALRKIANDIARAWKPILDALEPPPPGYYEDRRRMQIEMAMRARRAIPLVERVADRPEIRRRMMPCQRY